LARIFEKSKTKIFFFHSFLKLISNTTSLLFSTNCCRGDQERCSSSRSYVCFGSRFLWYPYS